MTTFARRVLLLAALFLGQSFAFTPTGTSSLWTSPRVAAEPQRRLHTDTALRSTPDGAVFTDEIYDAIRITVQGVAKRAQVRAMPAYGSSYRPFTEIVWCLCC